MVCPGSIVTKLERPYTGMKTINHYYTRFAWQLGYGAFSVSPSILDNTIRYIKNQAEHHRVKTFQEEYKMILDAYGINMMNDIFLRINGCTLTGC